MLLVSARFPLPPPPPPPPPTPLSALFTQSYNHHRPCPPQKYSLTQHNNLRAHGPLSTTKKYMRSARSSLLPLVLAVLLLAQTSVGGSGAGARTATHSGRSNDSCDMLSAPLSPLRVCLDGSCGGSGGGSHSQKTVTASVRDLCSLSTKTAAPAAPALAVGLLALLWIWVLDGAVTVLSLRARGRAGAARKGACRCRVCALRMQARGRPLHDISARDASAKKALGSCVGRRSPGYPQQAV